MYGLLPILVCAIISVQSKPNCRFLVQGTIQVGTSAVSDFTTQQQCANIAVSGVKGTVADADFIPCRKEDNVCLSKMAEVFYKDVIVSNPSLNLESLDPMFDKNIKGDLTTLKYTLTNSTLNEFSKCEVTESALSLEKYTMRFVLHCPVLTMKGDYEISGTILAQPIEGKGDFYLNNKDYDIVIEGDLKVTEEDGKSYLSLKSSKVSGQLHGGSIDLKNLFNGQKELADKVLKEMNDKWPEVSRVLQVPVLDEIAKKLLNNFNKYFKSKPLNSLVVN